MATGNVYRHGFDEDVSHATTACPECDGHVTTNTRETVCDECGLVIDESRIDHGAEWHSYDEDVDGTDPSRVGAPLTPARHDRGLSTRIGFLADAKGNRLDTAKRRQLGRLRREQRRAVTGSKRGHNLREGCCEIRRIAAALGLGDSLRDQACQLFRTAHSADLLRGRSIEAVATASVYAACRCQGLPRTRQEFVHVARVSQERVTHAYDVLNRELSVPATPVGAGAYVQPFASRLDLPADVRRAAAATVDRLDDAAVANGRKPAAVAAAALYLAACDHGCRVTQGEVADVADVSAATVRARRDEILDATSSGSR